MISEGMTGVAYFANHLSPRHPLPFRDQHTGEVGIKGIQASWMGDHNVIAKTASTGSLTYPTRIISEIGWPSQGGNDCGVATDPAYGCTSDTDGAVASIDNLNTFMDGWVCDALNNGTTFFW